MESLKKLYPYTRPYHALILLSVFLAVPLSLIRLGPAPLVKYMIDHVLLKQDIQYLFLFPLGFIAIYLINFVVRFGHYFILRFVLISIQNKLKNNIFHHFLGLSADYFTTHTTGSFISRTSFDPESMIQGISCFNLLIREPITLILFFCYALFLNWKLTIVTVFLAPLLTWVFIVTGRNLKRYVQQLGQIHAQLYSLLEETFSGIKVIQSFGLESFMKKKFSTQSKKYENLLLKTAALEEASHPFVELLIAFILAPIIYFGSLEVLKKEMSPGDLFAFFTTFAMMMNPLRLLNDVNIKLHQASAATERFFEGLSWKNHLITHSRSSSLEGVKNKIELIDVSFAYPNMPEKKILKNIHLTIPQGKAVAVIGASGAGKSSLISLLPRLYDIQSGRIEIDGQDLKTFSLESLRKNIAIVSQDVFLFNDTIKKNIQCGHLEASDEEIKKAAEQAFASDFIEKLPHQWDYVIGDQGKKLSGGERQRISIARAFLRKAPFLILDEATSHLDTASESAVQKALESLMLGKTTLIIAHRLSTIRYVDHIYVLKNGCIVENGSHEELLALGKEYSHFYHSSAL